MLSCLRQEYWSGLPIPSPGDLPNSGIKFRFPALQADSLLSEPPGKPSWERFNSSPNRLPEYQPFKFLFKDALSAPVSLVVPTLHSLIFWHNAHVIILFRLNGNSSDT